MLFVDPAGDDSGPGTIEHPFATLGRARETAVPGTVVNLRAGTHRLTEPLRLSAADSGVVYQAYRHGTPEAEKVVISGGRRITGRLDDDGVWRAEVPGLATRQLYVSGRRAERAAVTLDVMPTRTETGYLVDGTGAQRWSGQVEFVYSGVYPWSEARIPASKITAGDGGATVVTMAQPAFDWATRLYRSVLSWEGPGEIYGVDSPTRAENSPAFLTEGTFALSDGVLHYLPFPGEDLDDVVVPVLETLLHAREARDVVFRGIVFAEATWLRPGTPEGFLHYHGNGYYDGGPLQTVEFGGDDGGHVIVPGDAVAMPGNVVFENCSRVTLESCRFTRLGTVALEFRGDGTDNVLRDAEIDDVSGGGVVIGTGARGHRIENTHIHHIGRDYRGSPAVLLSGTRHTVLAHNQINDVPHNGIVVNEGHAPQVLNNLVHDTMQVLADGGGIYLSGNQGTSDTEGALVQGNVVRDVITPYNFGLYTDYGATWVTVKGNVVHRADKPAVFTVYPPMENVTYTGNIWDADPGEAPEGVTASGNTVLPAEKFDDDPAVADIVAHAGLKQTH
ncbi:right-handed parallel beta-helix repeat-containing protein [Rhizohabitans arisaemae]|uniref:right-handed parallel beta-helix repeat-containing protein n=1 Tax=Rhizohabitans arisaemae TaxID=2720610 RepID=UPI0024B06343|nr:right-handed parallel beta-helix repeat-containing protein [Rhizohabitans arisaemae]